jgi:hypothetical protein
MGPTLCIDEQRTGKRTCVEQEGVDALGFVGYLHRMVCGRVSVFCLKGGWTTRLPQAALTRGRPTEQAGGSISGKVGIASSNISRYPK